VFYVHTLRDDSRHLPTHYSWILLNLCFACVLIGAVLLTRSRAGIVALGAALFLYSVCFTFSHQRRRKALKRFGLFFAAVVFFLLTLGLKGVITELQTIFSALTHEVQMRGIRALTIGAGLQLIKESGLLGVGLGNFQMGWIFHHTPPFDHLPGTTFNDFIWLWAETGFPGIFFFAGALLCFIARALKKAFATNDYFISYFLLASVFSLLALSGHALVDPAFYVAPVLWLAFSVLGMGTACLCVTSEIETPPAAAPHGLPAKAGRNSAVAILAFIVLFMAVASGWFSVQKLRASLAMKEARDEQSIKRAMKLDPLNSSYSEMLASFYFREYEKNKNPEFLNESLAALDKAIRLDLFRYALDVQRAGILFEAGDERGVRETFDRLRERLPDFYLAELAASIFYMERAVQLKNNPQTGYFEDLAINHYHQVIELYPGFPEAYKIYNLGSSGASQHFQKLKKEGRI
ncbi:MAG TPA: O-antigen ligase family protein, partial [bacterium]|nr:O-antigen ligase family protein [bacterium]